MKRFNIHAGLVALVITAGTALFAYRATAAEADVTFSTDPAVAAQQLPIYDVVHRYENMLNTGDTAEIMRLYAPDRVAECLLPHPGMLPAA